MPSSKYNIQQLHWLKNLTLDLFTVQRFYWNFTILKSENVEQLKSENGNFI